ncbi:MAG TPA: outer membrane beta-barrel protein [Anaeromyxobacteraceae bacterium]
MSQALRLCASTALFVPLFALAQTAPAPAAAPAPAGTTAAAAAPAPEAPKPPPWYSTITLNGFVDAYYQARFDAAQNAPLVARAFDYANGFNLGDAVLSAAMAPAPAGFRLDLQFGNTASAIDAVSAAAAGSPQPTWARYVLQAYVAMKLGPVELDAGRFVTLASAEVVPAKDNWLYSRSLVYGLVPVGHTGARATLPLSSELTLRLGVVNGWDAVTSGYSGKTGEAQLAYAGPSNTTASLTAYVGPNPTVWSGAPNAKGAYRTLIDAVAGTTVGPLGLLANFDWATEDADAWWGAALAARWSFPGDVARLTVRGEFVKDYHGARFATGVDTEVYEGTAGVSVPVGGNSELRGEVRWDHANQAVFNKGAPTQDQVTGTVAALAWF